MKTTTDPSVIAKSTSAKIQSVATAGRSVLVDSAV
jgi:hypothetical protein